jgi:hypothetical protein
MQFMNLTMLFDFMRVLKSIKKHSTKDEYFLMHILFSTICSMQEQKLNHRNYSEKEINMVNFVQATEHDVHMYEKFGSLTFMRVRWAQSAVHSSTVQRNTVGQHSGATELIGWHDIIEVVAMARRSDVPRKRWCSSIPGPTRRPRQQGRRRRGALVARLRGQRCRGKRGW